MMSEKKLLSLFAEKMATDEAFAAKVASVLTAEGLIELAKSEGFEVSEEQAKAGLAKIKRLAEQGKTLNDDDLDNIAGGYKHACKSECFISSC